MTQAAKNIIEKSKDIFNMAIKQPHEVQAEQMAEEIFQQCPHNQVEILEIIKHGLIKLNERVIEKIRNT